MFGPAVECGWRQTAGVPLVLQLEPGLHRTDVILLDSRLQASEVIISAAPQSNTVETDVWIQSEDDTTPVLVVGDRPPPVTMHRLGFRGAIIVNTSESAIRHVIDHCAFNGTDKDLNASTRRNVGGGLLIHAGSVDIESTNFSGLMAVDGGAFAMTSSAADVVIARSHFSQNTASRYGGALLVRGGKLTMDQVAIDTNFAEVKGGAAYIEEGVVFLRNESVLTSNTVRRFDCDGASCGGSYYMASRAARMFYVLPVPPASYMTLTFDCRDVSIRAYPSLCPSHLQHYAELRNAIVAEALERSRDGTYPVPCPAGVYGVVGDVQGQRGNGCSGPCPAGSYCPRQTGEPIACPRGTYCTEGSVRPVPCPGGTYSSVDKLPSIKGCHRVPPGYYAPQGSPDKIPCPIGYRCPGAWLSTDSGAGTAPIRLKPAGLRENVSSVIEIDEVLLPLSMANATMSEEANSTIRTSLAALVGMPPDLIHVTLRNERRLSEGASPLLSLSASFSAVPPLFSAAGLQTAFASFSGDTFQSLVADRLPGVSVSRLPGDPETRRANFTKITEVDGTCRPGYWVCMPRSQPCPSPRACLPGPI